MTSPFRDRRLDAPRRSELLRSIVEQVTHRRERSVVVFDLDGTLLDNRARTVVIFHELAERWGAERPEVAERLRGANLEQTEYGVEASLERLGIHDHHDEVLTFWKARFFSDPYIPHDVVIPGAVSFVRAVHEAGANVAYLTGRDLPGMALGTFQSLRDEGFPIGTVGTELVTKPDFETPDPVFKRAVAKALSRLGDVLAVFDNEAANCNLLREAHPASTTVLLDTHFAADPPTLHPDVHVIDSFEDG